MAIHWLVSNIKKDPKPWEAFLFYFYFKIIYLIINSLDMIS